MRLRVKPDYETEMETNTEMESGVETETETKPETETETDSGLASVGRCTDINCPKALHKLKRLTIFGSVKVITLTSQ